VSGIVATLDRPLQPDAGSADRTRARRELWRVTSVRRAGLVVIGLQLVLLLVWSQVLASRFAVGSDFTGYGQAWYFMAHGNLDPFVSSWGEPFLRDHASFVVVALAPLWWVWPHPVTLLWVQDIAIAVAELVVFVWMCDVAAAYQTQRDGSDHKDRKLFGRLLHPPGLLLVLGLLLLVGNPWIYWTASFDFHFEVLATCFAVMAGYDLVRHRRRAWLWVLLTALSGDIGVTYVFGLGLSAVLAGRAWRKQGIVMMAVPVGLLAIIQAAGMSEGSDVLSKYLIKPPAAPYPSSNAGGWTKLLGQVLGHPGAYISRLHNHAVNLYGMVAPAGGIGLFCAWGFGVPAVVLAENGLAGRLEFSETAFQNFPIFMFVSLGTVMVLAAMALRWARVAGVVASVILASTLGWAIVWLPRTSSQWLRVSPTAAHILNQTLAKLPIDDEVIASHSVVGVFAERPQLYQLNNQVMPLTRRHVWFIISPSQGINTVSVQDVLSEIEWLAGPLTARLVAHGGGVWVFELTKPGVVTEALFPHGCTAVPAWAAVGAAGTAVVRGPLPTWTAASTGAPGYVVAGDYWRLPPGPYDTSVRMLSNGPFSLEVWDADRNLLLARRQVPRTYGGTVVSVPFVAPPQITYGLAGNAIFRLSLPPPPPHDQIEVRIYSPGNSAMRVSAIAMAPQAPLTSPPAPTFSGCHA
jgi:hypothetical protein